MSKRSRIVRRRMRAHESYKRFMFELLVKELETATMMARTFQALGRLNDDAAARFSIEFDHCVLHGHPTEIHDIEPLSESPDGGNFIYHPKSPNP